MASGFPRESCPRMSRNYFRQRQPRTSPERPRRCWCFVRGCWRASPSGIRSMFGERRIPMQTETVPMTPSVRRAPLEPEVHSPEPDTARLCEELATLTIEGFHLNYHLGTAVQHILCGACKLDDLQRARRHLDREICRIQKCEQIRERIHSAQEARVATGRPASANGSPTPRGAGKGSAPLHPRGRDRSLAPLQRPNGNARRATRKTRSRSWPSSTRITSTIW